MKNKKEQNQKNAKIALVIATLALIINFWGWTILSPLGTKYATELALNPLKLSFLLAIPIIIGSLGRIIVGVLTDKFGGKIMLFIVCTLTALPVFALSTVNQYTQYLLIAFFLGIGGTMFAVGVPYISSWFPPEKRGFALGIYSIGNAGTALSGFFTPRLSELIGRNVAYFTVSSLLVLMGLICLLFAKNSPTWRPQKDSAIHHLILASKQRVALDLSIIYSITFGAFIAFGVYLPTLLKITYNLSLTDASSRAAGFILLATLARPIGGWISDKTNGKSVVKICLLFITALASYIATQSSLKPETTIAYLSLAFMLGCCNGAVFALLGKIVKTKFIGSVTGIVGAAGGLGGFFPPLILGTTYQLTNSYSIALFLLAASTILVFLYINTRFNKYYSY